MSSTRTLLAEKFDQLKKAAGNTSEKIAAKLKPNLDKHPKLKKIFVDEVVEDENGKVISINGKPVKGSSIEEKKDAEPASSQPMRDAIKAKYGIKTERVAPETSWKTKKLIIEDKALGTVYAIDDAAGAFVKAVRGKR